MYKKWEKFERALDSYRRSLDVRVKLLGEEHPDTCATRHNLGELFVMWGKPEKAKEYF
jgi:hypothetical protein